LGYQTAHRLSQSVGSPGGATSAREQVGALEERTRRSLLARDMLSSTPAEVLARLDLDFLALSTSSTLLSPNLPQPQPQPQLSLPPPPPAQSLPPQPKARELDSLRALNGGQLGNGAARRPVQTIQHAQVPNKPWVPAAARTSVPPVAPVTAKTKSNDPLAKLKKNR